MKKYLSLVLTICIVLGCVSLISCNFEGIFGKTSSTESTEPTPSEPTQPTEPFVEEVDEKLKLQIIEYYLIVSGIQSDKKPEEIECEFYGKYGESVAVYFYTSGAYETHVWENVAEYNFFYRDSRTIKIWNNRKFYSMPEAFELGLINSENVKTIYYKYRSLEFQPPYFIYKHDYEFNWDMYYQIISQENFWCIAPGQVCVGLDHGISSYQKDFNFEFFQGIDYEYIEDITFEHRLDPDELPEGFENNLHLHYVIHLKDKSEEAIFEAISIIEKMDGINFVEPVYWFYPNYSDYRSTPNDPLYFDDSTSEITENDQWGLDNIEIEKVWNFTTGASTLRVGIIDSGIASHEDLNANYLDRENFRVSVAIRFSGRLEDPFVEHSAIDVISHGTHVAGIIGAVSNNQIGVSGINHQITLVQLSISNAFDTYRACSDAMLYANTQGIRILNFSMGSFSEIYKESVEVFISSGGVPRNEQSRVLGVRVKGRREFAYSNCSINQNLKKK